MQPAIHSHSADDGQMDMAAYLRLLGEVLRKRRDCFKPGFSVCSVKDIAICQLKKK